MRAGFYRSKWSTHERATRALRSIAMRIDAASMSEARRTGRLLTKREAVAAVLGAKGTSELFGMSVQHASRLRKRAQRKLDGLDAYEAMVELRRAA